MTKNIKLLLSASTVACFSIALLQGCGSDDTTGGTQTPGAGATNKAGASGAGAPGGAGSPGSSGAPGGAGAPSAGAGGGATAGAPSAGAGGGATAGAGGASGGASGAAGAGGAKGGAGGTSGAAGAGGGSAGAGGGAALTCTSNTPFPAQGETCATYCANYETTCQANVTGGWTNTKYATKAACLTDCNNSFGYTGADIQAAICCRGYHVKNAAMGGTDTEKNMNKNTHCPHAAGIALCK